MCLKIALAWKYCCCDFCLNNPMVKLCEFNLESSFPVTLRDSKLQIQAEIPLMFVYMFQLDSYAWHMDIQKLQATKLKPRRFQDGLWMFLTFYAIVPEYQWNCWTMLNNSLDIEIPSKALLIRSICCFHGNHGFTARKKGGWNGNGDARLINKGASCPIYTLLDVQTKR